MHTSLNIRGVLAISFCLLIPLRDAGAMGAAGTPIQLITPTHAQSIYRHLLEHHWVSKTGLFLAFPDSADRKIAQQASTYEQAAMGLLALQVGDVDRAKAIVSFFQSAWVAGPQKQGPNFGLRGLSNFYNAEYGSDGIEKTIHVGPNAWAGLLAARLANQTHDREALQWAMDVAYWIANGVPHENGAVAMGPRDTPQGGPWAHVFSTENNLSYYAFLTELLRSPSMERTPRAALTQERDRVENWLLHTCVNTSAGKVYRGVNTGGLDKMQALDTVTWLISAIGPKRLAARGINAYQLMRNAEKNFEVTVGAHRGVDPTDQAEADFVWASDHPSSSEAVRPGKDKHRMIWYEGMGQYILAWTAVGEFEQQQKHADRAKACFEKAKALQAQFDQATLPNYPGRSAYPYATPGKFFRDGWRSPAPSDEAPASSLIASVWRLFAGLGVDPLAGRRIANVSAMTVALPTQIKPVARPPATLYGTSEDMVVQAWRQLNDGELDAAIEQAQATIQEWSTFGEKLQKKKMAEVGQLINFTGDPAEKKQIFSYWALNDVGAAYFILGKAYDQKKDYGQAAQAFRQVMTHYSLAQVWDPQGWFWAPADAVVNEYASTDSEHYGAVVPQDVASDTVPTGKRPN